MEVQSNPERNLRKLQAERISGLYVILDPEIIHQDPITLAGKVLAGGAGVIQWRAKKQAYGDQYSTCQRLQELCDDWGAVFIVNDHADLAYLTGAGGVHLGQHDLSIQMARLILNPNQLIGRSNALVEEALQSFESGADYIAVGSIFPTTSKVNARPAGLVTLREVRKLVTAPLVAIGGINPTNVADVITAGADAVAVINSVVGSDNPTEAAKQLVFSINTALESRNGHPR